jgi:hypothetical protein
MNLSSTDTRRSDGSLVRQEVASYGEKTYKDCAKVDHPRLQFLSTTFTSFTTPSLPPSLLAYLLHNSAFYTPTILHRFRSDNANLLLPLERADDRPASHGRRSVSSPRGTFGPVGPSPADFYRILPT